MKPTHEDVRTAWEATVPHTATAKNIRAALEAYIPRLIERLAREAEETDTHFAAWMVRDRKPDANGNRPSPENLPLADWLRSHLEKNHD